MGLGEVNKMESDGARRRERWNQIGSVARTKGPSECVVLAGRWPGRKKAKPASMLKQAGCLE